jgi:hypothetical protein
MMILGGIERCVFNGGKGQTILGTAGVYSTPAENVKVS